MIHFKSLFYKNFLSSGNAGTTILLDKSPTTLVQGQSGAGKSTMIDALCFALYGKPFRDINKPGLVNSVNGKNCEVEVVFTTNARTYKVIRGIKPTRFDIYCDDKLVTQDAAVRDYQKVLENQILMMTFKTFTQIVILGSTAFTPFMQLSAAARREVIEDILDIGVFSTMNQLLKQQIQETKDHQALIDTEIKTKKVRAEGLNKLIQTLSSKKDERIAEVKATIEEIIEETKQLDDQLEEKKEINQQLSKKTEKLQSLIKANTDLLSKQAVQEVDRDNHLERQSFFENHDNCPTCLQSISEEHKAKMVSDLQTVIAETNERLSSISTMRSQVKEKIDGLQAIVEQITSNNREIDRIETTISMLKIQHSDALEDLQSLSEDRGDIQPHIDELREVAREAMSLSEKKKDFAKQRLIQESASTLLKDTGIKTAIIKEYLPLINRYLNKYLVELQMDVEFTLDENFNEVVKSRHRDDFVYGNFSEGEKLRIDISLLLCWRHIAKLKNSASTNLLIIDEVLSGRLDQTNQDIVIDMVNSMAHEGSNIFIIAHQDSLVDKFRSGIRFEKQGNFSVMV